MRPRLVECALLRPVVPWRQQRHRHDEHELLVVRAGTYRVEIAGERIEIPAGACLHLGPGTWHHPCYAIDGRLRFWVVRWSGGPEWPGHQRCDDHGGRLAGACDWMWALAQRRDRRDRPALDGLLAALVHEARLAVDCGWRDDTTTHLVDFLRNNCEQRLSLAQLGEVVGASIWSVLRRFRRDLGTSPLQMQKRFRVERAQRLIAQGMARGEAARRVGYAGAGQLAKAMRTCGRARASPPAADQPRRSGKARRGGARHPDGA